MAERIEQPGGWKAVLGDLVAGRDLSTETARAAIAALLSGETSEVHIAAFLVALAAKRATATEVAAMVESMLEAAEPLALPDASATVDIVGTGGSPLRQDRAFNISTTACFVVAGGGVPVCKHGNRKASSSSGSTDLLEALGINVDLNGEQTAGCVAEAGIGFAFARAFHPAMRHVGPVRAQLGIPTVFNILGPLSHPGRVTRQIIGVADPTLAPMVAGVLASRGAIRAMVVHGSDGLDELTLSGPTTVHDVSDGVVTVREIDPRDLGLEVTPVNELGVGAPDANADVAREILAGGGGRRRDLVRLNAAAGFVVAGRCDDLSDGLALAAESIDSGSAQRCLERLIEVSNRP